MDSTILPVPARSAAPKAGERPPPPIARSGQDFGDILAQMLDQMPGIGPRRPEPVSRSEGERPVRPADAGVDEDERREPIERPDDEVRPERPEASESRGDVARGEHPAERPEKVERTEEKAESRAEKVEDKAERREADSDGTDGEAPAEGDEASGGVEVGVKGEANPVARGPDGPAPVVPAFEVLSRLFPDAAAAPAGEAGKGPVLPLPEGEAAEAPVETPEGEVAPVETAPQPEPVETTPDANAELPQGESVEEAPPPPPEPEAPEAAVEVAEETILFETDESAEHRETDPSRTFSARGQAASSFGRPGTQTVEAHDPAGQARPEADPRNIHPNPAVQALARANANAAFHRTPAETTPSGNAGPAPVAQGPNHAAQPAQPAERATQASPATPARPAEPAANPQIDAIERIVRMAKVTRVGERSTARVWLTPPDLGSVRVTVTVERGVVTANLSVETAAAREALLADLPQLGSQLESQGMKLGSLDVGFFGADSGRQPEKKAEKDTKDRGRGADDRPAAGASARGETDDGEPETTAVGHIGFDSVDLFA